MLTGVELWKGGTFGVWRNLELTRDKPRSLLEDPISLGTYLSRHVLEIHVVIVVISASLT